MMPQGMLLLTSKAGALQQAVARLWAGTDTVTMIAGNKTTCSSELRVHAILTHS